MLTNKSSFLHVFSHMCRKKGSFYKPIVCKMNLCQSVDDYSFLFGGLFAEFRIGYSGMIDSFQTFDEYMFCQGYVTERDGTFFKEPFFHLLVNEFVNKVGDSVFCIFVQ